MAISKETGQAKVECIIPKNGLNSVLQVLHSNGVTRITIPTGQLKGADESTYRADDGKMSISNGKTTYKLGDRIDFKIDRVNLASRMIFGTGDLTKTEQEVEDATLKAKVENLDK